MSKQKREQNRTERAAAIRAQQAQAERNRRVGIIAVVVVVILAILGVGLWLGRDTSPKPEAADAGLPPLRAASPALVMGKDDAPAKVVVFEDFLCPYCREFEKASRDFLADYAEQGKVQVEYRPINLLQSFKYSGMALGAWAAVLENDSPQAAYRLHNALYDNQPYEQSSDKVSKDDILRWVKKAKANVAVARDGIDKPDEAFFKAAAEAADEQKVQGTPTVFINGTELTGSSVDDMARRLDAAIKAAK